MLLKPDRTEAPRQQVAAFALCVETRGCRVPSVPLDLKAGSRFLIGRGVSIFSPLSADVKSDTADIAPWTTV
ncbi:hypothetical protein BaRGS_00038177 [Batillaria attramentaria]|uniref:Uncharacterized protein n=1 Tax=Batillaria attramentaria TaxID=370345 RepID=A0ABD0J6M5_9CAEN